jgi:hypothetical protein
MGSVTHMSTASRIVLYACGSEYDDEWVQANDTGGMEYDPMLGTRTASMVHRCAKMVPSPGIGAKMTLFCFCWMVDEHVG